MVQSQPNRRLAAILAADVVGYSRMMGADEAGTLSALKHHREIVFDPAVADHNGRVFKLIGDGTLVEFGSVVDAVNCALAIQRAVRAQAAGSGILLRIGVNLGDVIIEGDDMYGDGVNVAARLEPLAEPGGVCVAAIVNESVGNRIDVAFRDGGEVSVKNIARPVRVWKWHPDHDAAAGRPATAAAAPSAKPKPEQPSIAVLPFDNMSGDPEQEYFTDGITEDIITDLSKVSGLLVIARNSSFTYKGKSVDIRAVGRELGVRTVLEGSIRRAGDRIRITAQLIDAATGGHVWAERFDRDLTDIFEVQDEVTRRIVDALKVQLTPSEAERIAETPTDNLEALELVQKGRSLIQSPNINARIWKQGADLFARAIALDSSYAQAYALLSLAHIIDFTNRWSDTSGESLLRCEELAAKAIAADPNEPLGHVATAVAAQFNRNFDQARVAVEKALELSPNLPLALYSRGSLAVYSGDHAGAVPFLERAMRVDPGYSQQYLQFVGLAHLLMGHYETAAAMFRERLLLAPQTDLGRSTLASALGHLGEIEEARRVWAELKAINPNYSTEQRLAASPFKYQADADRIRDGLAKAGILD